MLDSGARVSRALTYFGAGPVPTVLVQHEPGDRAARAPLERDLRIGLLDEEVAGRLGPELHWPVACVRLGEERVALERHPQLEPRREPVQTDVLRERGAQALDERVLGPAGPDGVCQRVLSGPWVLAVREALAERVVGVLEVLGD